MSGITTARQLRYATLDDPVSSLYMETLARDLARELDALDAQKLLAMKRPCAMVSTGSVTVPVTTVTPIAFTTVDVDTHGMVNLGTQPTRITVTTASGPGMYVCVAQSDAFNSGSWTSADVTLQKNGGAQIRRKYYNSPGNTTVDLFVSGVLWLAAVGDYVTMAVYHEGGATDNLLTTRMKVFKLTTN